LRGAESQGPTSPPLFRAKRKPRARVSDLLPASQGQNLALTVLYVPSSLDSGCRRARVRTEGVVGDGGGVVEDCPDPVRRDVRAPHWPESLEEILQALWSGFVVEGSGCREALRVWFEGPRR